MNIFQRNIAQLRRHNSEFCDYILGVEAEPIRILNTVNDSISLEARGILLHSQFEPEREAQMLSANLDPNREIWSYGFGLGYLARNLLEKYDQEVHILPMWPSVFRAVLELKEFGFLENERLHFHFKKNFSHQENFCLLPAECLHAAPQFHNLRDELFFAMREKWLNKHWVKTRKSAAEHVERNREAIESGETVQQFIEKHSPQHDVLIIGAGPSLDMILKKLPAFAKDKFVLVLDAAFGNVIRSQTKVDAVLTLDPSKKVLAFFNEESIWNAPENCALIYFPITHFAVLQKWRGQKYAAFSIMQNDLIQGTAPDYLETQGSVLHPALSLSLRLGAERIYLAGIDLAFPGNKTHAENTPGKNIDHQAPNFQPVESVNGEFINSRPDFLSYLRESEEFIARHQNIRFFNCSPVGAKIYGTHLMDILSDA